MERRNFLTRLAGIIGGAALAKTAVAELPAPPVPNPEALPLHTASALAVKQDGYLIPEKLLSELLPEIRAVVDAPLLKTPWMEGILQSCNHEFSTRATQLRIERHDGAEIAITIKGGYLMWTPRVLRFRIHIAPQADSNGTAMWMELSGQRFLEVAHWAINYKSVNSGGNYVWHRNVGTVDRDGNLRTPLRSASHP